MDEAIQSIGGTLALKIQTRKDDVRSRCRVVLYDPQKLPWDRIKHDILGMEKASFGDAGYTEEEFCSDFQNPENVIVIVSDSQTGGIVGLAYAGPLSNRTNWEVIPQGREDKGVNTAYIEDVVIDEEYQKCKLLPIMMEMLESELKKKGFKFLERDPREADGYAEKIVKACGERIIYQKRNIDPDLGPQRFIRMKL